VNGGAHDASSRGGRLDAVVLDLDDTLYDTTALLLPGADRRGAAALRSAGLAAEEDEIARRIAALRAAGCSTPLREVARTAGLPQSCVDDAERAWFVYEPPAMALDDDVAAALDALAALAPLALLTAGDPSTQRRKVERLGIASRFVTCRYAGLQPDPKTRALAELLAERRWDPSRTVVCGDRPDGDVRAANRNGCRAVLVRREGAEFAAVAPACADDVPWRTIAHVRELPALLRVNDSMPW
jgi:FMN phosphatase YigB (HAD superfamily)